MSISIDRNLALQIVETVQSVCGHAVNFIRADGIILASTRPDRVGTLHPAGRDAARSGTVQEVTQAQGGSQPGVNLPVLYNKQLVAVIGITGTPEDVRQYAHLAERITLLLLREQELNEYSRTQADKRRYAIDALLHPGSGDTAYLTQLLTEFGIDTDTPKRLVLLRLHPEEGRTLSALIRDAEDLCRNVGAALYHFYYPDELAAVLDAESLPKAAKPLRSFARSRGAACAIGIGKVSALGDLASSYNTARTACRSAGAEQEGFVLFDDLTWEPILADLQPDTRTALYDKTLSFLTEKDKALLREYFARDASLQKTCADLFLHKNTLQYRLNRIAEKCGSDPRNFREGALLYLALRAEEDARMR